MTRRQLVRRMRIRLGQDEQGFTIVELMVAISIFALVVTGVTALTGTSLTLTRNNRNRAVAANLASQEMDTVRSTAFTSLPIGQVTSSQSVDGVDYSVIRETEWVTQNATTGPCQAPSGAPPAYLRVTVSVTWAAMNGVEPPSTQTVVTPPIGTYSASTGHIAASVIDPDGQPLSGVLVTSTGPNGTNNLTTTSDGCAFFAYQPAGSYSVKVTAFGFVDGLNNSSPTQSTTVTVGATSSLQFQFGDSTDLVVDYHGWNGASVPATVPITVANSHLIPAGTHVYTGSGTPRTIPDLFPWSDGYSVFGGSCADADPIGVNSSGVSYYPNAVRAQPVDTNPGGTSSFHLDFPEVLVYAEHSTTFVPIPNLPVQAVHAPDNGCPSGQTFALGNTDSNGEVFSGLPYGTWAIYVNGTLAQSVTLTPAAIQTPHDVYWSIP